MDPKLPVTADLHRLTESAMVIGPLLRKPKCSKAKKKEDIQKEKENTGSCRGSSCSCWDYFWTE